mmetsp:Transcript_20050/g.62162  ORF Transcript_20050/g.62162 Transcript_20050/m.62162 type:complete len:206 (+) Transcript_20050:897-1514(+)
MIGARRASCAPCDGRRNDLSSHTGGTCVINVVVRDAIDSAAYRRRQWRTAERREWRSADVERRLHLVANREVLLRRDRSLVQHFGHEPVCLPVEWPVEVFNGPRALLCNRSAHAALCDFRRQERLKEVRERRIERRARPERIDAHAMKVGVRPDEEICVTCDVLHRRFSDEVHGVEEELCLDARVKVVRDERQRRHAQLAAQVEA